MGVRATERLKEGYANGSGADIDSREAARRANAARQICRERSGQKSAEAIVVEETSRWLEDARINNETGGLTR